MENFMKNDTAAYAIDRIVELTNSANELRIIEGDPFYLDPKGELKPVPFPEIPHEACTYLTSIESFCELVKTNPQKMDLKDSIITIDNNFEINLLSGFRGKELKRFPLARVTMPNVKGFTFNHFYTQESFIIALMSQFIKHAGDWDDVFQISKRLCMENDAEITDDGMGQRVQIKKGVSAASMQSGVVKTDYSLSPYRIYTECVQPESIFFLRIHAEDGTGIEVGLFETDGGAWRVEAKKNIAAYIKDRIAVPVFY